MYFSVFESACAAVYFSDDNRDHEFEKINDDGSGEGHFRRRRAIQPFEIMVQNSRMLPVCTSAGPSEFCTGK
jgi:hypothetical protein